ncbi:NAD(P)-binding protein [Xylariaceae sp. AK1471]|nr:NAD(P)-binding protein [Xylariaceae sp. AK1471]
MTFNTKKIIAVVGATGHQGSSVAQTFSSLPSWHVRAITRNSSSETAKQLAKIGCDVVQADLNDKASLSRAFEGAHAVFLNTDFWATYRASVLAGDDADKSALLGFETEVQHGRNAAEAATGVPTLERFIYSALGPMNAASKGKYPTSYHWEGKAAIVNYIEKEQPELAKKTSIIYIGAYATNPLLMPKPDPATGEYQVVIPCNGTTRFPITDEDNSTGVFVRALVEDEAPGTKLLAYDSYLTVDEAIEVWSRVTGKPAKLVSLTVEQMHERTGLPYEVLWAAPYIEEYGYMGGISNFIEAPQLKKKVATSSWEDWLKTRDMNELLSVNFRI